MKLVNAKRIFRKEKSDVTFYREQYDLFLRHSTIVSLSIPIYFVRQLSNDAGLNILIDEVGSRVVQKSSVPNQNFKSFPERIT